MFQMPEVAVPRKLFQEILSLIARLQRHALQHEGFGVECSEALTASSVPASCRSTTRSVRELLRTPHRYAQPELANAPA